MNCSDACTDQSGSSTSGSIHFSSCQHTLEQWDSRNLAVCTPSKAARSTNTSENNIGIYPLNPLISYMKYQKTLYDLNSKFQRRSAYLCLYDLNSNLQRYCCTHSAVGESMSSMRSSNRYPIFFLKWNSIKEYQISSFIRNRKITTKDLVRQTDKHIHQ